jgi:hypothetical protein
MQRRQRGVNMHREGRFHAGLTVEPPGERLAVAEETRDLDTRGLSLDTCTTMQIGIDRSKNDEAWLDGVFPVEEDHQAQATLKRLVPHHGSLQRQMGCIVHRAKVLDTAQGLEVDLAVICAPGPASLRVRTRVEKPTGRIAPPCGARVQRKADDFSTIVLLRLIAVHAMIDHARWQALPRRAPWLLGEVDPALFRLGLRGLLPRWRLRDGERQGAPACDLYDGERGHLQPAFGTTRTAVEEGPAPTRLLATLRDAGGVMRRDHFRAWVEHRHQHALMHGWPLKRLPQLPCAGAFSVGAVATQVAEVDATTPHKHRDEPRGQELPLW